MKMKKSLVFVLGILLAVVFVNFVSAEEVNYSYSYDYNGIQITSLKYEPYPANPGEYFDVWLKVKISTSSAYAKVEFLESFPFGLDANEDAVRVYEGFLGDVVLHYKVRVDDNAVEGINELKFEITSARYSDSSSIFPLDIYVSDAQTDFDLVMQDSSDSEISLAIANIGKNTANSMIVRIPSQEGYSVSGTSGQMVGNLDSGDYTIVSFEVSKNGRSDDNPLQIQIDYTDSIGERRSVIKEIDFGSGGVVLSNQTEMSEDDFANMRDFGGMPEGNFPGQQKKAKWPYFLAIGLVLVFVGAIFYGKYKRQIKKYFRELKKEKVKEKSEKEKTNALPEWMMKETSKLKKR